MHTPGVTQYIAPETVNRLLKNGKFFGGEEGALSPVTPVNPYLGGRCTQKWTTFLKPSHISLFRKFSFEINIPLGAILGASQVSGVWTNPQSIERVNMEFGLRQLKMKKW